jgi:hypothetical protein
MFLESDQLNREEASRFGALLRHPGYGSSTGPGRRIDLLDRYLAHLRSIPVWSEVKAKLDGHDEVPQGATLLLF